MLSTYLLLAVVASVLATSVLGKPVEGSVPLYYWDQTFPAQKTSGSMFSAVAVDYTLPHSTEIYVAQRSPTFYNPIIVYDYNGHVIRTWGSKDIPLIGGSYGVDGIALQFTNNGTFVLVADMNEHTVKKFTPEGVLVARVGTPGVAGTGTNPIQFGNVADIAVGENVIFVADGEGGVNDRIVAFDLDLSPTPLFVFGGRGSSKGQFRSPQSVTYHANSGTFFIADRGNNRTVQVNENGTYLGEWTCMRPGSPWGIRNLENWDILFQADGAHQTVMAFMSYYVSPTNPGPCLLAESFDLQPSKCNTPHEIGVDQRTGDMYVACAGAIGGHVRRYIPNPNALEQLSKQLQ